MYEWIYVCSGVPLKRATLPIWITFSVLAQKVHFKKKWKPVKKKVTREKWSAKNPTFREIPCALGKVLYSTLERVLLFLYAPQLLDRFWRTGSSVVIKGGYHRRGEGGKRVFLSDENSAFFFTPSSGSPASSLTQTAIFIANGYKRWILLQNDGREVVRPI